MTGLLQTFAAAEPGGIAALGIDPLAILAQAVTFLTLFFLIKKFALSKIVDALEDRRKTIDKGVSLGIEMQAEKDRLDNEIEIMLQKARTEADKIIASSHEEAGAMIKEAEAAASQKADTILADAQARITDEMSKARKDLKKEMLELVSDATEVIIGEKLDARKDQALLARALVGRGEE